MRSQVLTAGLVAILAAAGAAQQTPASAARGDWPMYRHDLAGTGHSPLDQITPRNVAQLAPAWTVPLGASATVPNGTAARWPTSSQRLVAPLAWAS